MDNVIPIRKPPMTHARRQATIDEFGLLQQQVDTFKPKRDRHEELRKEIAAWYTNEPANQPYLEHGKKFTLQVSPATMERRIFNMPKLFKLLGVEIFLKLCKFPLAAVDVALPATGHGEFLTEDQTGPRKIRAIAKTPVPAKSPVRMAA